MEGFHERMRAARLHAGLGRERVARRVSAMIDRDVSSGIIRRLEGGPAAISEEEADERVVAALADVYGVPLRSLSDIAANRAKSTFDLLSHSFRWNRHKAA